ncbi:MAG: PAS domain-containing sensor histidine kinase [Cyclobacteriaceae bacterium]
MQNHSLPEKDIQEGKSLHAQAEAFRLQESLLNAAGLGIITTTPDGVISTFNPAAENLLGYSASEVVGKATPLIFHDPDEVVRRADETSKSSGKNIEPAFAVLIINAASQKVADRNEWTFVRKNGSRFPASLSVIALRDDQDNITGFAGIIDSKSNLEEATLQLQEQNRKLDEFAHIISHNLRAPVSNIQALINLLDEKSEITDYKLIFDKLKNVAKNLSETMNELMDTLKAKTQPDVDRTEIRFKELLDKVVQSLEGELIVAQASVTFDFNEASAIHYSKPYLESIFQNLLTNAIKYRSPNRKPLIHFRSSMVDNHLELKVTDNGQGIDMERFGDKVFGLHKTFHEHQEARGVGLFLIKTQIEALGGKIAITSEVDKGTTFTIRFN